MNAGQRIYLLTEDSSSMKVPDLTGESLRDAMEVLSLMKVGVIVKGEGYVVSQKEQVSGEQRTIQLTLQTAKAAVTGIADEDPESSDAALEEEGTAEASSKTEETGNSDGTEASTNETDSSSGAAIDPVLP